MTNVKPNNGSETKLDILPYLSLSKTIKIFQWLPKSKFVSFMTKVNPKNGAEAKSDIFPWDIVK